MTVKRLKQKQKKVRSPYIVLLSGFAILILLGSLLLLLPIATKQGKHFNFIDSLFLSTSAVCVTGLISSSYSLSESLTPFGIIILFFLVEIGGLGFITLVTFGFSFKKKKVGVQTNLLLKEAMNQNSYHELIPLAKKIVITSFSIQGIGVFLTFISLLIQGGFSPIEALGYSIFHAASSFNNAGFDLFGSTSLISFQSNFLFMFTTGLLITLGGIGFVTMFDIFKKRKPSRWNLHTKIVLETTFFILIFATIMVKISDFNNISWSEALMQVIFARTAGFYSVNLPPLKISTLIIIMIVMFIGGSPASIAGGVKTTTLYTIVKSIFCFGKGKKHIISYNREINQDSILKSYVLVTLTICFIALMTFLVSITESYLGNSSFKFIDLLFECVSAFATCGTTLNVTSSLCSLSKLFIILLMYFGRLGPITFLSLLNSGDNEDEEAIRYVEGDIIIG